MGLLDTLGLSGLQQKAQEFSTNPLGMASLGLLLQPRRRQIGEGGFQAALQGMEAAAANRQAQAYEESLRQQDELRKKQYELDALQYGYGRAEAVAKQTEKDRALAAEQAYLLGRTPEERTVAEAMGVPAYAKMQAESTLQPSTERLPVGSIQEYNLLKSQGDPRTFAEYLQSKQTQIAPNYQAIPTAEGIRVVNTRTGQIEMGAPGVLPAAVSPEVAGRAAEAKAAGTFAGQSKAESAANLPDLQAKAQATLGLVNEILQHPGLPGVVGAPSAGKIAANIPGTKEAGFMTKLDQLKGEQFLQAYESLKGGGAISQIEGTKAEQAISSMNTAQSEAEFKAAANQFKQIITNALRRAQAKAGGGATMTPGGMPVTTDMQGGRVMDFNDLPE